MTSVLVLRAPGTNCDRETAFAFERAGANAECQHVNRLLEKPRLLDDFQILCLPGGFSYGDDLGSGKILANQIRHHLADAIREFRERDKLILGICNGFQILVKSGLLFDDEPGGTPTATLDWNGSARFEDRWVQLSVMGERCVFLRGIQSLYLPVAHGEGRFAPRDEKALCEILDDQRAALRYAARREVGHFEAAGNAVLAPAAGGESKLSFGGELPFPDNPNGSAANIAGVCDRSGRVFGLMPHPERYIDRTQHPRWTRGGGSDPGDGQQIFKNAVEYFG